MASPAEIRDWLRDQGHDMPDRGRIPRELRALYDAEHQGANGGQPAAAGPDYPPGMTDDLFETATADEPDDLADSGEATPDGGRGRGRGWRRIRDRARTATRPARGAKHKHKRLPVDDLIGSAWRIAAKLAQPVPPMYRVPRIQSPVAGLLLEDTVKGTVVDTVLQPLARLTTVGQTGTALLGPPAAIGIMAVHSAQAAKAGREPSPVVLQGAAELLRHGLIAMMRIGGPKFKEVLEREKEEEELYGADVEALMAWILAPPADPATEEQNIAAMAARFAGETVDG